MTRKMFKNYHTARNINLTVLVVVYLFILAALSGFFSGCQRDCGDTCTVIVSLDGFSWDYPKIYDFSNYKTPPPHKKKPAAFHSRQAFFSMTN